MFRKRLKWNIIPGLVCTLDANNLLKQDVAGVNEVIVIGRVKRRPFKYDLWEVYDAATPKNEVSSAPAKFTVAENLLLPSGMSIIRHPVDIPTFNELDVAVVEKIIDSFDHITDGRLTINTKDYDRLKALREKMLFTIKMREV